MSKQMIDYETLMILKTQAHLDGKVSVGTGGTSITIPLGFVAFQIKLPE